MNRPKEIPVAVRREAIALRARIHDCQEPLAEHTEEVTEG